MTVLLQLKLVQDYRFASDFRFQFGNPEQEFFLSRRVPKTIGYDSTAIL